MSQKSLYKKMGVGGAKYNWGVYLNKFFLMFLREMQIKREPKMGEMGMGV